MSILGWFLKPKKEMAKKDTKHVKLGNIQYLHVLKIER